MASPILSTHVPIQFKTSGQSPVTGRPSAGDTVPVSHTIRGSTKLSINRGDIREIEVDRAFRYIGGHRFILRGSRQS